MIINVNQPSTGGGSLFRHNLTFYCKASIPHNVSAYLSCQVITASATPFTEASFGQFLYELGYYTNSKYWSLSSFRGWWSSSEFAFVYPKLIGVYNSSTSTYSLSTYYSSNIVYYNEAWTGTSYEALTGCTLQSDTVTQIN